MKRTLLLFTTLLMGLTAVSATTKHENEVGQSQITNFNRYAQPIIFVERGIEFLVFPDGTLDFDANKYDPYHGDVYYKTSSKRSNIDINYRGPNVSIGYSSNRNRGVYVSRDRNGMVRRVGNVFINYNRLGQVTRIGSVYLEYGRGKYGMLRQVGGLRVNYNRWGEIVNLRGHVNHNYNDFCNICGVTSCNMSHVFDDHERHDDDDRHYNDHNDSHYYYKHNGKVKKFKKRRK